MKKVIVTGANGFLGRYLVNELVNNGYEVWAIMRNGSMSRENYHKNPHIHTIQCDLLNISNLGLIIKTKYFDCFYHLAWSGSSGTARGDYKLQLHNTEACVDAALAAISLKCKRFVGAGSVTELLYRDYLNQDGSEPDMTACYAIAKITAEYMTRCICKDQDIDFLWNYISNFYGIGDPTENFINMLIKNYINNKTPDLTEGNQKADFIYVSDVAKALLAVGEKGISGNTYYIGYGQPKPLKYFVKTIHFFTNPTIDTGLGRKKFHGLSVDFEKMDIKKIYKDTQFQPAVNFRTGIRKTINWIKDSVI